MVLTVLEFTVNNGFYSSTSASVSITVVAPGQLLAASAPVAAGQIATASVPVSQTQAGVTATLNNSRSTQPAMVSVQTYSGNPTPVGIGAPGTTFVDLQVLGATSADSVTADFHDAKDYNDYNTITPAILGYYPSPTYITNVLGTPTWARVHLSGSHGPVIIQPSGSDGTGVV